MIAGLCGVAIFAAVTAWVGFQRIKGRAYLCMQPGFLSFLPAHGSLLCWILRISHMLSMKR